MHRLLLQSLEGGAPIRIDLGDLVEVDTAGVQLLLAYRHEARRRGIEVEWVDATPTLLDALRLLGLAGSLSGGAPR